MVALAGLILLAAAICLQAGSEFRGLWVDSFHAGFRNAKEVDQLIRDARAGNFNALLVEVRRRGDALYNSHLEPKASDVSPPDFDPLADLLSQAHDTNAGPRLEIHAWIVTYPVWDRHTTAPASTNHPYVLHPDWLTRDNDGATWDGGNYVFDPGHPGVQQHIFDVAMDIVTNYDVDGLNLDYIRYGGVMWGYNAVAVARFNEQYDRTGSPSPTDPLWMQWRRDQVTALVRKIYLSAIALKPHLKISADTICFAPGVTSTKGWTNFSAAYTSVLQDWRGWMEEGILDLNIPMVYFDQTGNHRQSWTNWNTFIKDHRYGRQAVIGPGAYLNNVSNTLGQIRLARESTREGNAADGVSLYSYDALTADGTSRADFLAALTKVEESKRRENHNPPVFPESVLTPEMKWKTAPTNGYLTGSFAVVPLTNESEANPIELIGPDNSQVLQPDATGFFGVANVSPGNYRLISARDGYRPVVTNFMIAAGAVAKVDVALERLPQGTAPFLALQPTNQSGLVGDTVSFSSLAAGSPPVHYQWVFEGQPIDGATNTTLVRPEIDFPEAGNYALVLSNAFGVATSEVARLSVTAPEGIYALRGSAGFDSAIVSWRTSLPTLDKLTYWSGTNWQITVADGWSPTTNHIVRLAELSPNTKFEYKVESRSAETNFVQAGRSFRTAGEIVVDNDDASFSGGWSTGNSASGRYGTTYRFAGTLKNSATSRAVFTPEIAVPGRYDIDVWNPRGSNRSTNATFVITYDRGVMSRSIDQTTEGGQWRELARDVSFTHGSEGNVSLSNETGDFGKVVIADAVRLSYQRSQDTPPGDNVPTWWADHFFGQDVDGAADPDHDLYSNREEFLLGSNPLVTASSVQAATRITDGGLLDIAFSPFQLDRAYHLEVSESLDPPHWEMVSAALERHVPFADGFFQIQLPADHQAIYRVVADYPAFGPNPVPVSATLNLRGSISRTKGRQLDLYRRPRFATEEALGKIAKSLRFISDERANPAGAFAIRRQ